MRQWFLVFSDFTVEELWKTIHDSGGLFNLKKEKGYWLLGNLWRTPGKEPGSGQDEGLSIISLIYSNNNMLLLFCAQRKYSSVFLTENLFMTVWFLNH